MKQILNKFILILLSICTIACATNKMNNIVVEGNNIDKWKKAVIHLESPVSDRTLDNETIHDFLSGKIDYETYYKRMFSNPDSTPYRVSGTAVFLKHNNIHYLLTARHVVHDEAAAEVEIYQELIRFLGLPKEILNQFSNEERKERIEEIYVNARKRSDELIYSRIFRVPTTHEKTVKELDGRLPEILMNLSNGLARYSFSTPEIDLAVINLDNGIVKYVPSFSEELIMKGYVPITMEDIEEGPTNEGENIMAVGFPAATTKIEQYGSFVDHVWSSNILSAPVFSFGKIAMVTERKETFLADISIYPGNSGGPLILNNKLVGIIIQQPTIPVENSTTFSTRIPFGIIVKAKHLQDLIKTQLRNEEANRNFTAPSKR